MIRRKILKSEKVSGTNLKRIMLSKEVWFDFDSWDEYYYDTYAYFLLSNKNTQCKIYEYNVPEYIKIKSKLVEIDLSIEVNNYNYFYKNEQMVGLQYI